MADALSPLLAYCTGAVEALRAQYSMTQVLKHSATSGSARESLIQNFLIDHLPDMASVVSGVIFDEDGNRSRQQDIVLMQRTMPRLRFKSGHDLIFREGAIATFEIKTSIRQKQTIAEIGLNIRSVHKLSTSSVPVIEMGRLSSGAILTVVVTYDGAPLPTIAEWLDTIQERDRPEFYLDLSKGLMIREDSGFADAGDFHCHYRVVEDAPRGLALFLTKLSDVAWILQLRKINWEKYIR